MKTRQRRSTAPTSTHAAAFLFGTHHAGQIGTTVFSFFHLDGLDERMQIGRRRIARTLTSFRRRKGHHRFHGPGTTGITSVQLHDIAGIGSTGTIVESRYRSRTTSQSMASASTGTATFIDGLVTRILRKRGIIIQGLAPVLDILKGRSSIKGFASSCGRHSSALFHNRNARQRVVIMVRISIVVGGGRVVAVAKEMTEIVAAIPGQGRCRLCVVIQVGSHNWA